MKGEPLVYGIYVLPLLDITLRGGRFLKGRILIRRSPTRVLLLTTDSRILPQAAF